MVTVGSHPAPRPAASRFGLALPLILCCAGIARADGEFAQIDLAPQASSAVGSIQRGNFGAAIGWSEWDTGDAWTAYLNYSLPFTLIDKDTRLRFGPSYRHEKSGEELGARVSLERYRPTDWGSLFLLADFNMIKQEYMLLAETAFAPSGLSIAVSTQGDSDGFREHTLAFGYKIEDSPVRLRAGYKFEDRKAFIGIAINTF